MVSVSDALLLLFPKFCGAFCLHREGENWLLGFSVLLMVNVCALRLFTLLLLLMPFRGVRYHESGYFVSKGCVSTTYLLHVPTLDDAVSWQHGIT